MVTIGMNYDVLPGKEATFENAFRKVLHVMSDTAGHTDTHLYRDIDKPTAYLIVSQWSDKHAFDSFIQSDAFRKVADWGKEQILSGRPRHEVYGA